MHSNHLHHISTIDNCAFKLLTSHINVKTSPIYNYAFKSSFLFHHLIFLNSLSVKSVITALEKYSLADNPFLFLFLSTNKHQ